MALQGDYVKRETQRRLDEETMKFIRMKRPRLQCKESGGYLVVPVRSRSSSFRSDRYLVAPARLMNSALVIQTRSMQVMWGSLFGRSCEVDEYCAGHSLYGHSSQVGFEFTVMESLLGRSGDVNIDQMEVINWSL